MTKTESVEAKPRRSFLTLVLPEKQTTLNVERILAIQVKDYFGAQPAWYLVSALFCLAFFGSQRQVAEFAWPIVVACFTPDYDDAGNRRPAYLIHFEPEGSPNNCLWLPSVKGYGHMRFTHIQAYFYQLMIMSTIAFLLGQIGQWAIYHYELPFFEQFKIQKDKPWPWNENPEEWRKTAKKSMVQYLFNAIVGNFVGVNLTLWLLGWKIHWSFEELPSNWTMFYQTVFFIFVEDTLFHHAHKLFHCKHKYLPLYQWVHKRHHEFKMPVSISAQYAHPVEHIFANILPTLAGPLILGKHLHFWMIISWGVVRMMDTHEGHSGYDFPWSIFRLIPFGTGPAYHDFHHSANVGNYSSFTSVWDTFWDTNTEFWEEYFPLGPRRSEGEHEKKE